jgi:hypothetical protein
VKGSTAGTVSFTIQQVISIRISVNEAGRAGWQSRPGKWPMSQALSSKDKRFGLWPFVGRASPLVFNPLFYIEKHIPNGISILDSFW